MKKKRDLVPAYLTKGKKIANSPVFSPRSIEFRTYVLKISYFFLSLFFISKSLNEKFLTFIFLFRETDREWP